MGKRDWSDYLNPVLVKEIRQYFHNRMILGLMGVLLGGQLMLLVFMQGDINSLEAMETARGKIMFHLISYGLLGTIFLICGVGSLNRFTTERRNRELDFSCTTTLSPVRIVWGKLLSAMIIAVFLYALSLPFMVIAYFLRGISMFEMALSTLLMLPLLLIAPQAGILFGSSGRDWLKALYFIVMLGFYLPSTTLFSAITMNIGSSGSEYYFFLVGAGLLVLLSLGLLGLLFFLSIAAVGHIASNRMLPVRLYLLVCLLLSPGIGALCLLLRSSLGIGGHEVWPFFAYAILTIGMGCVAVVATLAAFERENTGLRVLKSCPRNWFGRFGFFLISSGAAGGLALGWLLALLLVPVVISLVNDDSIREPVYLLVAGTAFYALFYAEVALLLRRFFPVLTGWAWWLVTMVGLVILPVLFAVASAEFMDEPTLMLVTTPFCLVNFDTDMVWSLSWIGPALALGFLAAGNGLLMFRQFRAFRRPGPTDGVLEEREPNGDE